MREVREDTRPKTPDDGPVLSIIVPVYNCEQWLERCLTSLISQTFADREIIVVDDGSTDNTAVIVEQFIQKDQTVSIIQKRNGGCASARSAGLQAARGKYVGFVDADDWIATQMYERLISLAAVNNAEIAQVGFYKITPPNKPMKRVSDLDWPMSGQYFFSGLPERIRQRLLLRQPSIWRRIYRKDFLQKWGIDFPVEIRNFDDIVFQFETLMLADRVALIGEPMYFYTLGNPNQSVVINDDRLFVLFDLFDYLRERHSLKNKKLFQKNFKRVQFYSHLWAQSQLIPELQQQYERRASKDIFDNAGFLKSLHILFQILSYVPRVGYGVSRAFDYWKIHLRTM